MSQKIFIIEDYAPLCRLLKALVELDERMVVCGTACSGEGALEQLQKLKPTIILADLSLPGINGFELIRRVKKIYSDVTYIVLSGHCEMHYAIKARDSGANGFVVKGRPEEVSEALDAISQGRGFWSPRLRQDGHFGKFE